MKAVSTLALLVVAACSAPPLPRNQSLSSPGSTNSGEMKLEAGTTVAARPKVNAIDLDGISFRTDMVRVGLQDFMTSSSPVLSYTLPQMADYAEIMRCNPNHQHISELLNAHMGVANNESLTRIVNNTNYWKEASDSNACTLLATSASSGTLYDGAAPSGTQVYLVRACVNQSRLTNTAAVGNRNCTAQVTPSNVLEGYQNLRVAAENQAISQMQVMLARADGLGRKIFDLTVDYNNALVACSEIKANNDASAQRFKGISTIFGIGASLGFALLAESPQNQTVEQVWANRDAIANRGVQIATVLQSLYVNPSDYLTECRAAEKVQEEAKITTLELRVAQDTYNQARTTANAAAVQRQQLESH